MGKGGLRIGVVMDPVDKISIDKDTTFVLMLEAQQRGHEVYFMEVDDLFLRGGTPHGRYRKLELARANPHWQDLAEGEAMVLTKSFTRYDSPNKFRRPWSRATWGC